MDDGAGRPCYGVGMSIMTSWWWVRHAPVADGGGRLFGRTDIAADLSDGPAIESVAHILPAAATWLSSPLSRATATAAALLHIHSGGAVTPQLDAHLAEQDFGVWEGGSYDHIDPAFWDSPATSRPPNGESFSDVLVRVGKRIDHWNESAPGANLVAVAHAGVIRAALGHALGIGAEAALAFAIDPLSISRMTYLQSATAGWRIDFVNRRP